MGSAFLKPEPLGGWGSHNRATQGPEAVTKPPLPWSSSENIPCMTQVIPSPSLTSRGLLETVRRVPGRCISQDMRGYTAVINGSQYSQSFNTTIVCCLFVSQSSWVVPCHPPCTKVMIARKMSCRLQGMLSKARPGSELNSWPHLIAKKAAVEVGEACKHQPLSSPDWKGVNVHPLLGIEPYLAQSQYRPKPALQPHPCSCWEAVYQHSIKNSKSIIRQNASAPHPTFHLPASTLLKATTTWQCGS